MGKEERRVPVVPIAATPLGVDSCGLCKQCFARDLFKNENYCFNQIVIL